MTLVVLDIIYFIGWNYSRKLFTVDISSHQEKEISARKSSVDARNPIVFHFIVN